MKQQTQMVLTMIYFATLLLAILVVGFDLFVWRPN